jgi:hypothetical protein
MNVQGYRENYLAALEAAHADMDKIYQECELLQLRQDQLQGALSALEPFLRSVRGNLSEFQHPEAARPEQMRTAPEPEIAKPIFHTPQAPEPEAPAAFSPVPDAILDPIQHRINRALGLAVA